MHSRYRIGNIYTIEQVNELIRDLKLIQKPRELGDKLNIEDRRIDPNGYLTKFWRTYWYSNENRKRTADFVENRIDFAFKLVMDHIPRQGLKHNVNAGTAARNAQLRKKLDSEYIKLILENISLCISGIESLRDKTYLGDDAMTTRLNGILTTITVKLDAYQNMFTTPPMSSSSDASTPMGSPSDDI